MTILNKIQKALKVLVITLSPCFLYAQEIRLIDNKGTISTVNNNNVTTGTEPTTPLEADIWFDTTVTPNVIKIRDNGVWRPLVDNNKWSITGNTGTSSVNNFLGTTDAQDLVLRTNNTERMRITNDRSQVRINGAPIFNNHPLVIQANGVDVLAFQDAGGVPRWHWNLLSNGLNFVESNVADFRLFLENDGNVGVNTNDPTERLDVNGKLRVRDITEVTTNNDILTVDTDGVVERKKLIAAETNNQITTGTNGGVYLGPTVYTGSFIINAPGGTTATTFNQAIPGLPFQPSQITFVAHANIQSFDIDSDSGSGNNDRGIPNSFGTMNGFARNDGAITAQNTIYVGGHGNSINDISRYSSNRNCIGLRYGDQNGNDLGKITASLNSFDTNGFTLSISYSLGTITNIVANPILNVQPTDILSESLVVLYTAYK